MKKNKIIFIILLSTLALIILGIFIIPQIKSGYLGETITVLVPKADIPARTLITEDMIKEVDMPREFLNVNRVLTNKEEVVNKYSTRDILDTDFFTKEKITNESNQALFESTKLIGITMPSLSASVGGIISPGDRVNIYGYKTVNFEETGGGKKVVYEDLKNIEIAYILNNQGIEVADSAEEISIPAVVVLKVDTDQQIQELLNLEFETKIHLERVS